MCLCSGKSAGRSKVLQLVLVGPRGSGKSLAGNSILGSETFKTGTKTLTCQTASCKIGDCSLTVVDTPGLTGKQDHDEEVMKAITNVCQDLLEPLVIFLLVVPMGWNAKKSHHGQNMLRHALGKLSRNHLMVLVTHADQIWQDECEEDHVLEKGGLLQLTVDHCGGWFHLFNTETWDSTQVLGLLDKLDEMLQDDKKTHKLSTNPEEQSDASAEKSHHLKAPKQEIKKKSLNPESHSPEQDCNKKTVTEASGGMDSVKKNLQNLEDQIKSEREEEEELTRGRNVEFKAQLQKLRQKRPT